MNIAIFYLVARLFYRIGDFFHHWYVDGSRSLAHHFILTLQQLDRTLALRITIKFFFQPLYKDYTIIGRILGVIFRSGRIVIGAVVYAALVVCFLIIYAAWLVLPAALVYYASKIKIGS